MIINLIKYNANSIRNYLYQLLKLYIFFKVNYYFSFSESNKKKTLTKIKK